MTKITVDKETIEQALEALEDCRHGCEHPHKTASAVTALRAARAEPAVEPTYTSTQATACASCGEHKHTPLRIDKMGGYVCLTCIDQKLGSLLGELGYQEETSAVEPVAVRYDLRDRLVAISAAIADQDDRAAQAMIREILSAPPPPAEVPLLTDEEIRSCADAMDAEPLAEGWGELSKFARATEQAVRQKAGLK